MDVEKMVTAYKECALWTATDEDGNPIDSVYTIGDFSDEADASIRADVENFLDLCEQEGIDVDALDPEQVGHDFCLTRNHHGAGFWDRGLGELGERLTEAAHSFGESYVWAGSGTRLDVEG